MERPQQQFDDLVELGTRDDERRRDQHMVTAAPVRLLVGWTALALTLRVLPDLLTRAVPQGLTLGARVAATLR